MKQFTHAWLAFMAIKRLENVSLTDNNRTVADNLILWFKNNKDGVIRGAWYPDSVIKDNANSHVLKINPAATGDSLFKDLPNTSLMRDYRTNAGLYQQPYAINPDDNLPDRCEALAHAVIDNLKIQFNEEKGSAVAATDNHIAQLLFMLSHYVADAHMPLHCDSRSFSSGADIHGHIEKQWEKAVEERCRIDVLNQRFIYDAGGYPLCDAQQTTPDNGSVLSRVETELDNRPFRIGWAGDNGNVWDFITAVCQHSYLAAYALIPQGHDHTNVTTATYPHLNPAVSFDDWSVAVLADAVDSIARIWFRIWRRYLTWEIDQQ